MFSPEPIVCCVAVSEFEGPGTRMTIRYMEGIDKCNKTKYVSIRSTQFRSTAMSTVMDAVSYCNGVSEFSDICIVLTG
jgi:hypothetical protein